MWGALLGATTGAGLLLVAGPARASCGARSWRHGCCPTCVTCRRESGRALLGRLRAGRSRSPSRSSVRCCARWRRASSGCWAARPRCAAACDRAGLDRTVHEFRIEQVQWGLVAFAVAAAWGLLRTLGDPGAVVSSALVCALAFVAGVLGRDHHLSDQVRTRERRILAEFPTVAELLALAVAAGESPVGALDRVVSRSGGELSADLARVLAEVRTGEPVGAAFDTLAATSGLPLVSRFAQGIATAVERGTPLADVLHAQAADVREAGRRELIESAARREVLMMVPVVFLVLPVTILFAFWPGVVGLDLTTP